MKCQELIPFTVEKFGGLNDNLEESDDYQLLILPKNLVLKQSGLDIVNLALQSKAVWSTWCGPVVGICLLHFMSKDEVMLKMLGEVLSQDIHWELDPDYVEPEVYENMKMV